MKKIFQKIFWVVALTTLSTGCLQTRNEKIELSEDLQKQRLERFILENVEKPYAQLVDEQEAERKRLTVYEGTRLSLLDRRERVKSLNKFLDTVPEDPVVSYEEERHKILDRHWTDVHGPKQP